jgi:hypothetical protein
MVVIEPPRNRSRIVDVATVVGKEKRDQRIFVERIVRRIRQRQMTCLQTLHTKIEAKPFDESTLSVAATHSRRA